MRKNLSWEERAVRLIGSGRAAVRLSLLFLLWWIVRSLFTQLSPEKLNGSPEHWTIWLDRLFFGGFLFIFLGIALEKLRVILSLKQFEQDPTDGDSSFFYLQNSSIEAIEEFFEKELKLYRRSAESEGGVLFSTSEVGLLGELLCGLGGAALAGFWLFSYPDRTLPAEVLFLLLLPIWLGFLLEFRYPFRKMSVFLRGEDLLLSVQASESGIPLAYREIKWLREWLNRETKSSDKSEDNNLD